MKLDRRTIHYRIFQNGLAIGAVILFGLLGPSVSQGGLPGLVGGLILVGVIVSVVAWWQRTRYRRYEYYVNTETFDIESGVFSRRHREIPYERIQNVDISQNPLQRAIGIAEVRLETAGGSESEAALRYVSTDEADRLQDVISRAKRAGTAPEATDDEATDDEATDDEATDDEKADAGTADTGPAREELFALQDSELWILGFVTADLRLLGLAGSVLPFVIPSLLDHIQPELGVLLVFGALIAAGGIFALWAISGLYAILRYYGFRLVRAGGELRYERGLLQRYSGTIPLQKIQTVTLTEGVLARRLGYASVRIGTAGYGPGQNQGSRVQSAVPIAKRERALSLARQVHPVGSDLFLERLPKRARTRYAIRYTLALLLVIAGLGVVHVVTASLPWWPAGVALVALTPPAAHLKWVHRGYYLGEDFVVTRRGFWTRKTTILPYHRAQTLIRSQTLFQRRRALATLVVDSASRGGIRGGDAVAPDLDAETSLQLYEDLNRRFQAALSVRPTEGQGPLSTKPTEGQADGAAD